LWLLVSLLGLFYNDLNRFWFLWWSFDLQKCVGVLFGGLAVFTEVKIIAHRTLVSRSDYWIHFTPITNVPIVCGFVHFLLFSLLIYLFGDCLTNFRKHFLKLLFNKVLQFLFLWFLTLLGYSHWILWDKLRSILWWEWRWCRILINLRIIHLCSLIGLLRANEGPVNGRLLVRKIKWLAQGGLDPDLDIFLAAS